MQYKYVNEHLGTREDVVVDFQERIPPEIAIELYVECLSSFYWKLAELLGRLIAADYYDSEHTVTSFKLSLLTVRLV